jgi:hypothetical protein
VRSPLPLNTLAGTTNFSVSFTFQVAAAAPTRDRLALTTILRRKGRVLDAAFAASMQTLLGPQAITAGAAITAVFYLPASPLASGWWTTAALKN